MERLTDCAQGYCEMYCKKYRHCFGDPGDCIFKEEIKLYDAVKSIEGIVLFDRLLELADADRAGRLVVLPCKVGDTVWAILDGAKYARECKVDFVNIGSVGTTIVLAAKNGLREQYGVTAAAFGKTVFLTREEAEAALSGKGGDS